MHAIGQIAGVIAGARPGNCLLLLIERTEQHGQQIIGQFELAASQAQSLMTISGFSCRGWRDG